MRDQGILKAALDAFRTTSGLLARVTGQRAARTDRADAVVEIEVGDRRYRFLSEVKAVDRFATPAVIKARSTTAAHPPILVAPYVTRETAEHCRNLKLPFIDTAGNAYIEAEGLLVYVVGLPRPTDLVRDKFRALTPAGLQVTFAILCRPDLLQKTYREIARAAKVALGTVGPVLKDLQGRGFVHGARNELRAPGRLMEEWVTRYATTLRPKLGVRRFAADPATLTKANLKGQHAFWGGEFAADRLTHMLRPSEFTIYSAGPWTKLASAYRLRADPHGNLEVLRTFWDFPWDGPDADLAPPLLIYADLMASQDGRNIEIARRIHEQYLEPKLDGTA